MNKPTFIKAEVVNGNVSISSCGKGNDVLTLAAVVYCAVLNNKLKDDCPVDVKQELAHSMIDDTFEKLKTAKQEITTINLPG